MNRKQHRFTVGWDPVDPFDQGYPHLWVKVEHLGRYQFAARYLKSLGVSRVADVGCGTGYGALELAEHIDSVIATDVDPEILDRASEHYPHPRLQHVLTDIERGKAEIVAHCPLDAIVAFEVLEHLKDPGSALRRIRTFLRCEGVLVLSVPNSLFEQFTDTGLLFNREHRRLFTISSITTSLEDAGYTVEEVLGQPLVAEVARNEARLIRRKLLDGRASDEPSLHSAPVIRRFAAVMGQPEPRDVERSYSITVIAKKTR